jgi:hypothetical protein
VSCGALLARPRSPSGRIYSFPWYLDRGVYHLLKVSKYLRKMRRITATQQKLEPGFLRNADINYVWCWQA